MSDILSQIQAQSAGLASVEDLRKQAIEQHGVDLGNFTGAMNAYRQGRQQIGQFSSTEKIDVIGLTSPITRRLGKAAYQKIFKPAAKKLYEKATSSSKPEGEEGEGPPPGSSTEMSDIASGDVRQVPKGSGVSEDGEQITGNLGKESLQDRYNKLDDDGKETADNDLEEKTGSPRANSDLNKPASEYEGGLDGKVDAHQNVSDSIAKGEADQAARKTAEEEAAATTEEAGTLAAESAVPGIGEVAMVGTLFYQLFHSIHKANKEESAIKAPTAPGPVQLPSVDFDSAPVIDSSNFHAL